MVSSFSLKPLICISHNVMIDLFMYVSLVISIHTTAYTILQRIFSFEAFFVEKHTNMSYYIIPARILFCYSLRLIILVSRIHIYTLTFRFFIFYCLSASIYSHEDHKSFSNCTSKHTMKSCRWMS